ncbi:MAG TPA: heat-inducible transcription repressor HrcA [Clostridiaceae bacterium]|nr:heat-inducible transcription repressor HrcA [Clostridiaceae bacterium]
MKGDIPIMLLDDRKRLILKAVVDDYIATSEPIGSKSIVKNHNINLSSATVRNIMAELEKGGYLMQPHTSAGRVPSDKGYRAYVDSLMDLPPLTEREKAKIEQGFDPNLIEVQPLLKRAVEILSETTGYTALAVAPYTPKTRLTQLKILMIEPGRALIVVVLSGGLVKNRLARVPEMLTLEQLMLIANLVEENVAGTKLEDITFVTIETSVQGIELPESLLNQVLYEAYVSIKQAENLETYVGGITNLFRHQEFSDVGQTGAVANLISKEGGMIIGYMNKSDAADDMPGSESEDRKETAETKNITETAVGVEEQLTRVYPNYFMIRIGQEIAIEPLEDCSFVTTTCETKDRTLGHISVVGPKRMDYNNVISHIGFVRRTVHKHLAADEKK